MHDASPLLETVQGHDGIEDPLVRFEREQGALDGALHQLIAAGIYTAHHVADAAPVGRRLHRVEAGFPVDVLQRPRAVADEQLQRDEIVVRVGVGREMREIAVRERTLGVVARAGEHLPADRPRVAVVAQVASEFLRLDDVGSDASVEVRLRVHAQDFLKGRSQGGKTRQHGRSMHQVGDRSPRVRLARHEQQQDRHDAEDDEGHFAKSTLGPVGRQPRSCVIGPSR